MLEEEIFVFVLRLLCVNMHVRLLKENDQKDERDEKRIPLFFLSLKQTGNQIRSCPLFFFYFFRISLSTTVSRF